MSKRNQDQTKTQPRKLVIRRETLRQLSVLSDDDLQAAVGGTEQGTTRRSMFPGRYC